MQQELSFFILLDFSDEFLGPLVVDFATVLDLEVLFVFGRHDGLTTADLTEDIGHVETE